MLEVVNRCNLKSTWCTMYPGGYPSEFYRTLKKQDFEIAAGAAIDHHQRAARER